MGINLALVDEAQLGANPFGGKEIQTYSPKQASENLLGDIANWPLARRSKLMAALSKSIESSVRELGATLGGAV